MVEMLDRHEQVFTHLEGYQAQLILQMNAVTWDGIGAVTAHSCDGFVY